jgi:hypothetical protein
MIVDRYRVENEVTIHDLWNRRVIHSMTVGCGVIHRLEVVLAGVGGVTHAEGHA